MFIMNTPLCSAVYRRGQKAAQSCSCPIMPTFLATLINKMHPTESKMFVTPKNHTKNKQDPVGRSENLEEQRVIQGLFKKMALFLPTDYGSPMKLFFIQIQNFWAWANKLGR